jgi:hypothetical protein
MYVPHPFKYVIRICATAVSEMSQNALAETFVHEAVHLAEGIGGEYRDAVEAEIRAVKVERSVMMKLYGCVFVDVSYYSEQRFEGALIRERLERPQICADQEQRPLSN